MSECRAVGELPLPDDLMSNAQTRPLPNVGAVDPRIPSLDPRSTHSIHSANCGARRRTGCGHALRTRLWVRRRERGYTNGQLGACPNVRAVDPGVRSGNGAPLQGELGLDRGAATHELVLTGQDELARLRKLTKCLLPRFGSSASRRKAQKIRCSCMAHREYRWGSQSRYPCMSRRGWQP